MVHALCVAEIKELGFLANRADLFVEIFLFFHFLHVFVLFLHRRESDKVSVQVWTKTIFWSSLFLGESIFSNGTSY